MWLIRYLWLHYVRYPRGWYKKARLLFVEKRVHHFYVMFSGVGDQTNSVFKVILIRDRKNSYYRDFRYLIHGDEKNRFIVTLRQYGISDAFWVARKWAFLDILNRGKAIRFYYQTDEDWDKKKRGDDHANA